MELTKKYLVLALAVFFLIATISFVFIFAAQNFGNAQVPVQKITGTIVLRDQPESAQSILTATVALPGTTCNIRATACPIDTSPPIEFWLWKNAQVYQAKSTSWPPAINVNDSPALVGITTYYCNGAGGCSSTAQSPVIISVQTGATQSIALENMKTEIMQEYDNRFAADLTQSQFNFNVTYQECNGQIFCGSNCNQSNPDTTRYVYCISFTQQAGSPNDPTSSTSLSCTDNEGDDVCSLAFTPITSQFVEIVDLVFNAGQYQVGYNPTGLGGSALTISCNVISEAGIPSGTYFLNADQTSYASVSYECT